MITADGLDVGWIQQRLDDNGILLGSIYVAPAMQRKGIGSGLIQALLQLGRQKSKPVTLAVMKINPAVALYERLGFRITHEDEYKVYMRAIQLETEISSLLPKTPLRRLFRLIHASSAIRTCALSSTLFRRVEVPLALK